MGALSASAASAANKSVLRSAWHTPRKPPIETSRSDKDDDVDLTQKRTPGESCKPMRKSVLFLMIDISGTKWRGRHLLRAGYTAC